MKLSVINTKGNYTTKSVPLHISDIEDISFEELVAKDGKDLSYFMVYLKPEKHQKEFDYINKMLSRDNNLRGTATKYYAYFQVRIPYDYTEQRGNIKPTYEEKLTSYEMEWSGENENDCGMWREYFGESVECELTDDEQLLLANVCIKCLLEDFVYCVEFLEKKVE